MDADADMGSGGHSLPDIDGLLNKKTGIPSGLALMLR